jgi:hypothetical protein
MARIARELGLLQPGAAREQVARRRARVRWLFKSIGVAVGIFGLAWTVLAAQALWDLLDVAPRALAHASAPGLGAHGRRSSKPSALAAAVPLGARVARAAPLVAGAAVPSVSLAAAAGVTPPGSAAAGAGPVAATHAPAQLQEHSAKPTAANEPGNAVYHGPPCSGVFVYIVTVAEQAPYASAASLAVEPDAPAHFVHSGQSVGDWEVLAIKDDWTGTSPVVWLRHEGEVCRARFAGNPQRSRTSQLAPQRRPMPQRFFRR